MKYTKTEWFFKQSKNKLRELKCHLALSVSKFTQHMYVTLYNFRHRLQYIGISFGNIAAKDKGYLKKALSTNILTQLLISLLLVNPVYGL